MERRYHTTFTRFLMLYIEPIPNRNWWLLIFGAFLALYLPFLGLRELQTQEAFHALVAQEMSAQGGLLQPTVQGVPVAVFPLYPWLVCLASRFSVPSEWATRLPAALAVLLLAALSGRMAARAGGHLAGAVASSVALTSVLLLDAGRQAQTQLVAAALIVAAWFAWYRLGRVHKRWGAAWATGVGFSTLAFLCIGFIAFAYFYFPLVFLRRPLRIWRRVLVPGHLLAVCGAVAIVGLWLRCVPGQTALPWQSFLTSVVPENPRSYLNHLIHFPFACAVAFLPWTFLAWPGFCVAFRPVEHTPIFCRFLRTLILPLWLAAWLLPGTSCLDLLALVGPLAVLTGLHLEILLRRHARMLRWVPALICGVALVAGGGGLLLGVLHLTGVIVFSGLETPLWTAIMVLLTCGVGLAYWVQRSGQARPFWVRVLIGMLAAHLVFLALYSPHRALYYDRRRDAGAALAAKLPPQVQLFKLYAGHVIGETFYLNHSVRQIASASELPAVTPVVYVLAGAKPPILETRTWTACSPAVAIRQRVFPVCRWRPAEGGLVRVEKEATPMVEGEDANGIVCVYKGELRPLVKQIPGVLPAAVPAESAKPEERTYEAIQRIEP